MTKRSKHPFVRQFGRAVEMEGRKLDATLGSRYFLPLVIAMTP